LASLPVSKLISTPAISTDARPTSSGLIYVPFGQPPVGCVDCSSPEFGES
jgi:hypothetical protein